MPKRILQAAEAALGAAIHLDKQTVRLIRRLGAENEHVLPVTDPAAARQLRMETRREWPDSPASDVPDRFPLFQLMGEVDLYVWPEWGCAIDPSGRLAAHLRDPGQWTRIHESTQGEVVVERLASGGFLIRTATTSGRTGSGFAFRGVDGFLEAISKAKAEIDRFEKESHEPQDRG